MTRPLTITKEVHFGRARRGQKVMRPGSGEKAPDLGRVPRVARLMALAIHMDALIRRGEVADYAELSRLSHVTRARVTQLMNLLHLAPEIQEELLFLPRCTAGRDAITEHDLRPIAGIMSWKQQRREWAVLHRSLFSREAEPLVVPRSLPRGA